jgi:hypothetical protein
MDQDDIDKARAKVEAAVGSTESTTNATEQSRRALERAIQDSEEILVTAATIGPIHKSTLTLNRTKLYAEERSGLRSVSVMSVRIEDVLNVNGEVGPISGFITIATTFTGPGNPHRMGPFHRKDVLKLKRIIQGYIIALQKHIDLSPILVQELIPMLYELGEDDASIR